MSIDFGYEVLCIASMTVLVLLALVCLIRCIMGPRISDRVMAVNMIGTLTIIMVVVFTVYLKEAYLADIHDQLPVRRRAVQGLYGHLSREQA